MKIPLFILAGASIASLIGSTEAATITITGATSREIVATAGGDTHHTFLAQQLGLVDVTQTSNELSNFATAHQTSDLQLSADGLFTTGLLSSSQFGSSSGARSSLLLSFTVTDAGAGVPFTFQAAASSVGDLGQVYSYFAGPMTGFDPGIGLNFGYGYPGGFPYASGSNAGMLTGGDYVLRAESGNGPNTTMSFTLTVGSVPEPSSVALILYGAFFCLRRRIPHDRNG